MCVEWDKTGESRGHYLEDTNEEVDLFVCLAVLCLGSRNGKRAWA